MSSAYLSDWIGRTRKATDTIQSGHLAKIAATFDCQAPAKGDPLPLGWHWAFFAEITPLSGIGRDGHQALGEFLPPITLPRRMWAAGEFAITKPLTVGETVEKVSTILSIEEKHGRSGALAFVRVGHQFTGNMGADMSEVHTIVYREAPIANASTPPPLLPKLEAAFNSNLSASPVQLFRYSAVTFNSHRIHYDVDFCRNEEGYDGLIIHGPFTATLLMNLAQKQTGKRLKSFTFRATNPLTHVHEFSIHAARPEADAIAVWACNHRGELAMQADAQLV